MPTLQWLPVMSCTLKRLSHFIAFNTLIWYFHPRYNSKLNKGTFMIYCGVMRAAATHTPSPTFTTSSSSALRSADCTLQFPEDRTRGRRQGILLEDPADDQEDHQDPGLRNSRHRHRGAGHADQVRW